MERTIRWQPVAVLAIAIAATIGLIAVVVPDRPRNLSPTPLTSEQLAQRPVLVYPQATDVSVSRGTKTFGPDEPRPKRPRLERRTTSYRVIADPADITEFYRAALIERGWQLCSLRERYWISIYRRDGARCDTDSIATSDELIVSVDVSEGRSARQVTVIETLPPPLEWPEP